MDIGSCGFSHIGKTGCSTQAFPCLWEVYDAVGERERVMGSRNNILRFPHFRQSIIWAILGSSVKAHGYLYIQGKTTTKPTKGFNFLLSLLLLLFQTTLTCTICMNKTSYYYIHLSREKIYLLKLICQLELILSGDK